MKLSELPEYVKNESNGLCKIIKKGTYYFLFGGVQHKEVLWNDSIGKEIDNYVIEKINFWIKNRVDSKKLLITKEEIIQWLDNESLNYKSLHYIIKYDNIEIYFLKRRILTIKTKNDLTKIKNTEIFLYKDKCDFEYLVFSRMMMTIYNYLNHCVNEELSHFYIKHTYPKNLYLQIMRKNNEHKQFNLTVQENKFIVKCSYFRDGMPCSKIRLIDVDNIEDKEMLRNLIITWVIISI